MRVLTERTTDYTDDTDFGAVCFSRNLYHLWFENCAWTYNELMPSFLDRLFGRGAQGDGFTQPQREAIVDLLLIAIYEDGRIAWQEDAMIDRQLDAFVWESGTDPHTYLNAATARVREAITTVTGRDRLLADISSRLDSAAARGKALELLAMVLDTDGRSSDESELLTRVTLMLA
jgi:hypothetical protein